ncbi:MAG: hypothetical protein EHM72_00580 [Calditrichaeota bacterium]|nr:MAG: hypothetical protein EHM72_00580 [Calditrichota bacterium]
MKENKIDGSEQILQVRELLFGEAQRQFEARLDALKNENENLRKLLKETEDKLLNINQSMQAALKNERESDNKKFSELLANLDKNLSQRIKNLEENKVDRSQIGHAFLEWGNKIQQIVGR